MSLPESSRRPQPLLLALAFSLLFHAAALLYPVDKPRQEARPAARMEARLAPRGTAAAEPAVPPTAAAPAPAREPAQRKRLAVARPKGRAEPPLPKESPARKREMDQFLAELGDTARAAPNLASRSLDMSREMGRDAARQPGREEGESVFLERIPDTPPVDPFSLEMYLDSLVKKLNRSASFVKNDVRVRGLRTAALQVRINPDGSLKSFDIIDAADQQAEVAFVRSVVDRAIPFAAFPPDMRSSTRSLTMTICILPTSWGNGGAGFSRQAEGRGC